MVLFGWGFFFRRDNVCFIFVWHRVNIEANMKTKLFELWWEHSWNFDSSLFKQSEVHSSTCPSNQSHSQISHLFARFSIEIQLICWINKRLVYHSSTCTLNIQHDKDSASPCDDRRKLVIPRTEHKLMTDDTLRWFGLGVGVHILVFVSISENFTENNWIL